MSSTRAANLLVHEWASRVGERVTRELIAGCQAQPGRDCSGAGSFWDDVCVAHQTEGVFAGAYQEVLLQRLVALCERLDAVERGTLWLLTYDGECSEDVDIGPSIEKWPVRLEKLATYLLASHVLDERWNFTNGVARADSQ